MTPLSHVRAFALAAGFACMAGIAWGQVANPPNSPPANPPVRPLQYGPANAAQAPLLTPEAVAARIIAATVTVRATYPVADPNVPAGGLLNPGPVNPNTLRGANPPLPNNSNPAGTLPGAPAGPNAGGAIAGPNVPANAAVARASRAGVAVASGVSLGKKLIISFLSAPATSRIRVTLPDGSSADARPVVVDHYSGLTLLEIDQELAPQLPLAPRPPAVGSTVYTAAGAGAEEPLLSKGMLSGTPRPMGSLLPPVLPCDVRITSSSSGAPLVDQTGRLIGIVAGADATGWAYAIPVEHVERLIKARPTEGVVVLERRQPVLGLILNPGVRENVEQAPTVEVARVIAGGPAEKAGFQPGDMVSAVDGKPVRILYDVSKAVLSKQPGDQVQFVVRRPIKVAAKTDPTKGDPAKADPNVVKPEANIAVADAGIELRLTIELGGVGEAPKAVAKLDERQMIGVAQPFAGRLGVQVPSVVISTTGGAKTGVNGVISAPLSITITQAGEEGADDQLKPVAPTEVDRLRMQLNQLQADVARRDREISLLKLQLEAWAKALQAYQKLQPREPAKGGAGEGAKGEAGP